jgi:CheY-like chemotaxis protein
MIFADHLRAESEAVFGSAARYNTDGLSDQDILIVDNDPVVLRRRSQVLKSNGWSVAAYSWSRLASLVRIRGLFVQHLKLEALILQDVDDRLKNLLDRFEPAHDYSQESEETCEIIACSTSGVQTTEERAWAMDVLAVTVRNLGILKLASTGRYNFDYHTVVRDAFLDRGLSDEDVEALLKLRDAKFLYRAGLPNHYVSWEQFEATCSAVGKAAGSHYSDFSTRLPFTYPDAAPNYLNQRLLERDLLVSRPAYRVDPQEFETVCRRVRKKLISPRDYAWQIAKRTSSLWRDSEWLAGNSEIYECPATMGDPPLVNNQAI